MERNQIKIIVGILLGLYLAYNVFGYLKDFNSNENKEQNLEDINQILFDY